MCLFLEIDRLALLKISFRFLLRSFEGLTVSCGFFIIFFLKFGLFFGVDSVVVGGMASGIDFNVVREVSSTVSLIWKT
mgnify:CR=1 FL=1